MNFCVYLLSQKLKNFYSLYVLKLFGFELITSYKNYYDLCIPKLCGVIKALHFSPF